MIKKLVSTLLLLPVSERRHLKNKHLNINDLDARATICFTLRASALKNSVKRSATAVAGSDNCANSEMSGRVVLHVTGSFFVPAARSFVLHAQLSLCCRFCACGPKETAPMPTTTGSSYARREQNASYCRVLNTYQHKNINIVCLPISNISYILIPLFYNMDVCVFRLLQYIYSY